MSILKNPKIPIGIASVTALIMILNYFLKIPLLPEVASAIQNWFTVIMTLGLGVGFVSVLRVHGKHIIKRTEGQYLYSLCAMLAMIYMIFTGLMPPIGQHPAFVFGIGKVKYSIDISLYALYSCFLFIMAYRALVVRSKETLIIAVCMLAMLLTNAPIGEVIWEGFPAIGNWIQSYVSGGAQRGVIVGVSLGIVFTLVRLLLGHEKVFGGG